MVGLVLSDHHCHICLSFSPFYSILTVLSFRLLCAMLFLRFDIMELPGRGVFWE